MTLQFRDYQVEAAEAVEKDWADGVARTAVVLPTGAGKTHVITKLAVEHARDGGRVLLIAHRDELLDQATQRFRAHAPDMRVGRIQGAVTQRQHRLTVASLATLNARVKAGRDRLLPVQPSMIVYDEAHHAASPSAMSVLEWAGSFRDVRTVGFTATMVRGDRRGLGDVWENVCYSRDISWAVGRGYLVRPVGRVVVASHMDLNQAKVSRGDYQDNELGDLVSQDADEIVRAWQTHAADRLTITFAPTIASAQELTDQFQAAGVAATIVTGTTPRREREKVYAETAAGRNRVICSVGVLTEGFDLPAISCVLQARPTRLPGLYQQMIGRGLRLHPGKTDCLVLDVVGASRAQRLTTLVDLSPSADYDTTAVDALPCEVCGLPTKGEPPLCTCPPEDGERDPSGGRRRLIGPATYEDLDLLLQTSGCVWLSTHAGVPFLPTKDRTAILWHNRRLDLYVAGHMANRGRKDGVWLSPEPESLDAARRRAEAWALEVDPTLASRSSSWRADSRRPSPQQIEMALRLGIPNPQAYTRGRLSDEVSIVKVSERLR